MSKKLTIIEMGDKIISDVREYEGVYLRKFGVKPDTQTIIAFLIGWAEAMKFSDYSEQFIDMALSRANASLVNK